MLKIINNLLLLALFVSLFGCRSLSNKTFTFADNVVVAHRGAWKQEQLPQNSIAALKHAIKLGCTGSEFDVRMTADSVLIVTHDDHYNGLEIEKSTYAELSEFKLLNGEMLPKLSDYIRAGMQDNDSTGLVCEIKPSQIEGRNTLMAEKVMQLVKELKAEDYIHSYISFSYELLQKIVALNPKAKTQFLKGEKTPQQLKNNGISGLDYHFNVYKQHPEWIKEAQKLGLSLNAWTVNKTDVIDWLSNNNFDYITTDEPELVFKRIKENPTRKAFENETQNKPRTLSVMTYNIRLDLASDGENAWANRKDFLSSQVLFYSPDILGVQEARPNQMADLKTALTEYNTIGVGRDGDGKGEHSAIFYNSKKVKVEQENTFWLSKTPNKVSKGWDAAYPRICTYGLFTMLENNQKIWVFNTHLDHVGKEARLQGMQLIQKKIKALNTEGFPVVAMGDFNVEPHSELMVNLKQTLNDSKEKANLVFGPNGTFNAFRFNERVTRRIDYIMTSKSSKIKVEKYGVLSSSFDLKYPSDHFPVFVALSINP